MSDRERDSIQEMEDIQKGLEAFLQQEMQEMQTSGSGSGKSGTGRRTAERPAPQMFDMTEKDEDEEELDVIGSGRRARADDTRRIGMIPRIVRDRRLAERRRVRLQRIVIVVAVVTVMQIVADRRHLIDLGVAEGRTMRTNTRTTKITEKKIAPEEKQGSVRR